MGELIPGQVPEKVVELTQEKERQEDAHMNTYEPTAGENISTTAERIIALAKETKGSVTAKFEGIELTVTEDSTAEDVVSGFQTRIDEAAAETYHKSPEGQRAFRESEEQKQEGQRKADALIGQLPNLDFANQEEVLDWICEFQDPSGYIDDTKRQNEVLSIFAEHGYQPNVNIGEAFNSEDHDNSAHYIIGQALDGLKDDFGAIHPIVHKFTDDWKKKFVA